MGITARAKTAFAKHGRLSIAAALSATALTIGLSATPASADGFSPTYIGTINLWDYQTGMCLSGPYGSISDVGTVSGNDCDGTPNNPPWEWGLYTTPYNAYNFVNVEQGDDYCLDSNYAAYADNVYTDPCNWNDTYQSWTFGGQGPALTVQDFQTGLCLDSNYAGNVYTDSCNWNNYYQNWNPYSVP